LVIAGGVLLLVGLVLGIRAAMKGRGKSTVLGLALMVIGGILMSAGS
jgi:hypothetical protein